MANKTQTIRIESILGGHSPLTHFAAEDQFFASIGIDPSLPVPEFSRNTPSGLLRPVATQEKANGVIAGVPMWIRSTPKDNITYLYSYSGSVYTVSTSGATGLGDLNDGGQALGNGMAYYDNYLYLARETTVARYGPLDGTAAFTDDYWSSTLSKTPLTSQQYPNDPSLGFLYPNHVMHRHSDGRLYFVDVVGGKGAVHFIKTTKTTAEGDTDDGSTYNALEFGYGLFPTALESYGTDLVIALLERRDGNYNNGDSFTGAKIAFWDTVSQRPNKIIWDAFPDGFISALKNINGILYIVSGTFNNAGFRVSRFVGGETFEEVFYSENGQVPTPGAVDGDANRLLFGSLTTVPEYSGCIWSFNLQKNGPFGIFNVARSPASTTVGFTSGVVTAFALSNNSEFGYNYPEIIGWSENESETPGSNGIDVIQTGPSAGVNFDNSPAIWWSKIFKVGQPFKITKIRIPLAHSMTSTMKVTPTLYGDSGDNSQTLTEITSTNFGSRTHSVVIRPVDCTFDNEFWLELKWGGTRVLTVGLPITIEYELLDIDTIEPA